MAVRPFYVEADIEGRQTMLGGGPKRSDGTMKVSITQRCEGSVVDAFVIRCTTDHDKDGNLMLRTRVIDPDTNTVVAEKLTKY